MAASRPNSLHNSGYGLFFPLFIKRRKILILPIALFTKVPKQRPLLTFQARLVYKNSISNTGV